MNLKKYVWCDTIEVNGNKYAIMQNENSNLYAIEVGGVIKYDYFTTYREVIEFIIEVLEKN